MAAKVRPAPVSAEQFEREADSFTRQYLETALWSTSAELGECQNEDCTADDTDRVQVVDDKCATCGGKVRSTDRSFQDLNFDASDCSPELLGEIMHDCREFQREMEEHITDDNLLRHPSTLGWEGSYGHDFWLTRNGHGAGYWDGDYEEPAATVLTKCAHGYGECGLYVGDDGKVYGG